MWTTAPVLSAAGGAGAPTGRPVLVVDDDPTIRAMLRGVLELEGCAVLEAADGREALNAAGVGEPCVIFLDMRMPVMDGWGFAAAYRKAFADPAPIVVMTAARDAGAWAAEVGADAVLAKPFDLGDVDALIQRYCRP
jgi:two-component system chemotaxis response regulator CheY